MTKPVLEMTRGAKLSEDGTYRYVLGRRWAKDGPVATLLGLNPSTADGTVDDATVLKCVGFAQRWGCSAFHLLNLFAYRARQPADLWHYAAAGGDPVGPENDEVLQRHVFMAYQNHWPLVAAWGAFPKADDRAREVVGMMGVWGNAFQCLGYSKGGQPRHPLMLAYATPLEPYRAA